MKESYIVEEFVSEYGIRTIVMGIREVPAEEAARRIEALRALATETFEDGSFVIETSEDGICSSCKDHAAVVRSYDANGVEEDDSSNCCGTSIYTF